LKRRRPGTLSPPRRRPGQGGPDLRTCVAVPAGAGDRWREEAQRRCRARISRALAPRGFGLDVEQRDVCAAPVQLVPAIGLHPSELVLPPGRPRSKPAVGTAHPGQGISEAHDEHEPWYRRRARRTERTRARERASPPMRTAPRKPCQSNGRATASRELGSGATAVLSVPRTSPQRRRSTCSASTTSSELRRASLVIGRAIDDRRACPFVPRMPPRSSCARPRCSLPPRAVGGTAVR
jgi:hypothetical protein